MNVFELKGKVLSLTVLQLNTAEVGRIEPELQRRGLARTTYAGATLQDHLAQFDRAV